MRRRALLVPVVPLALALGVTGCDAGPLGGDEPPGTPAPSVRAEPPTPAQRLGLRTGWGPGRAELERAARLATGLTLPQLAGQVIVASFTGTAPPVDLVRRLHLGGVVVFTGNAASTGQVRSMVGTLRARTRRTTPLMVTVDQEGGLVQRVRGEATRFPAFMASGAAGDPALTRRAYAASGAELRGLGFDVDLAPVADVTIGAADPAIGARSAADDPAVVTRHALAASRGFLDAGVVPVVKHFPGHGSVTDDSHRTLPVQRRSVGELERRDWRPFRAAVEAGLPAVMVGHLDVRSLDPGVPSSLSQPVVTGALRERLGFEGVVMTDSLQMAGARAHVGPARAAVAALRAGADVALMPQDPAAARAAIVRAVRQGHLRRVRLEQAAARGIALLLHQRSLARDAQPPRAPGWGRPVAQRLTAQALTSVAGPCRGAVLPSRPIPLGDPTAVASFRAAAADAGVALGRVELVKPPRPKVGTIKNKRKRQRVLRRWRAIEPRPVLRGTRVDLVRSSTPPATSDHVVAVDGPWVLGRSDARLRVAAYSDSYAAMAGVIAFWQGRAPAPGRLPVEVAGVRRGC